MPPGELLSAYGDDPKAIRVLTETEIVQVSGGAAGSDGALRKATKKRKV